MESLKNQVEKLIDESQYTEACNLVTEKFGLTLTVLSSKIGSMNWDAQNQTRRIFNLELARGEKKYIFEFGQSIANSFKKSEVSRFDLDEELIFPIGLKGGAKQLDLIVETTTEKLRSFDSNNKLILEVIEENYLRAEIDKVNEKIKLEDKKKPTYARRKLFDYRSVISQLPMCLNTKISKLKSEFTDEVNPVIIEPSMYDVLTCLTKYEVGSFEDFCDEFGYTNERQHGKIYDAVWAEYEAMEEMFSEDELEVLQCIQ
jgi:hypothetical protein